MTSAIPTALDIPVIEDVTIAHDTKILASRGRVNTTEARLQLATNTIYGQTKKNGEST